MLGLSRLSEQRGSGIIGMIGVLAVLSIVATTLVPNAIKKMDSHANTASVNHLMEIGEGVKSYMRSNRAWSPTLASLSPEYVPFAGTQLTQNENGYPRYYVVHPTTSAFTSAAGIAAADLEDLRFLLITNLTRDEAPSITNATEFDTWWDTDASATPGLFIYRGTLTELFYRLELTAENSGGSYQIDGTAINSGGATLSAHDRYHVRGSVIGLDDQDPYSTPEIPVSLVADEGYTHCSSGWQREAGCGMTLWLSTHGDASGNPGIGSWEGSEIVLFDEPNLTYESGPTSDTSGDYYRAFDLENFNPGVADVDGLHYVTRNLTIGTVDTVDVLAGDLLFSTRNDEDVTSTNSLTVREEDVAIFRPDIPNDYTAGTFITLIDGSDVSLRDIKAFTLVEVDTTVGGTLLTAGTFLLSNSDNFPARREDLLRFVPTSVGSTSDGALTRFLDGSDINFNSAQNLISVELIEEDINVGDVNLQAGQILGTIKSDDSSLGDNSISVTDSDIFILDVTSTGSNTAATATLFFEGSDVGLTDDDEDVAGIALK